MRAPLRDRTDLQGWTPLFPSLLRLQRRERPKAALTQTMEGEEGEGERAWSVEQKDDVGPREGYMQFGGLDLQIPRSGGSFIDAIVSYCE